MKGMEKQSAITVLATCVREANKHLEEKKLAALCIAWSRLGVQR